jgi:hypothetical protein
VALGVGADVTGAVVGGRGVWLAGSVEPADQRLDGARGSRPAPQAVHASTRSSDTACRTMVTVFTPDEGF